MRKYLSVVAILLLIFAGARGVEKKKPPSLLGSQKPEEFFQEEFPLWVEQFMGPSMQKSSAQFKEQLKKTLWKSLVDLTVGMCPWNYQTFPSSVKEWKASKWVLFHPVAELRDYEFRPSNGFMRLITDEERKKILSDAEVGTVIFWKELIPKEEWKAGYALVFEVPGKDAPEKRLFVRDYAFAILPPMDRIYCVANQIFTAGMVEVVEKGKAGNLLSEWGQGLFVLNPVAWKDKEVSDIARKILEKLKVQFDVDLREK